jgi:hypothetical protein
MQDNELNMEMVPLNDIPSESFELADMCKAATHAVYDQLHTNLAGAGL